MQENLHGHLLAYSSTTIFFVSLLYFTKFQFGLTLSTLLVELLPRRLSNKVLPRNSSNF